MRINTLNTGRRIQSGNLTVLTVVFLIAIILPILFFGLSYLKIMASYQGQKSAIDVASLSVAQDLGNIVIEGPVSALSHCLILPPMVLPHWPQMAIRLLFAALTLCWQLPD